MTRALIWACFGWMFGVLALGVYGAWEGYANGWVTGRRLPPGLEAARVAAFTFTAYAWWLAGGLGALFGGLTGLGSASVSRLVKHKRASRQGHLP